MSSTSKQGSNTYLRLIFNALQSGGGGGGPAANVGVINATSTRINPSTLELQQALIGASFLPTIWRATTAGTGYAVGEYLLQKNISQINTPDYRWYVVTATGAVNQLTGNVPEANRELAFSSGGRSGGGIAVLYDIVSGATDLEGAWDIASAQVYPADGSAVIAIGSTAGNATNLKLAGERATNQLISEFTLNTQNAVSTPVAIPAGRKVQAVLMALKVTNYVSATNSIVVFYPEVSFFPTGASDEFAVAQSGIEAPVQGDTVGHTGSDSGALEGVTFIRVRRADGNADISADADIRLIITLR